MTVATLALAVRRSNNSARSHKKSVMPRRWIKDTSSIVILIKVNVLYVDSSGTDDHLTGYHVGKLPTLLVQFKSNEKWILLPDEESKAKPVRQKKRATKSSAAGLFIISWRYWVEGGLWPHATVKLVYSVYTIYTRLYCESTQKPADFYLGRYNIEDLYYKLLDYLCLKIDELIFRAVNDFLKKCL